MISFRRRDLDDDEAAALRAKLLPHAPGGAVIEESLPARDAAEADAASTDPRRYALVLYVLDEDQADLLATQLDEHWTREEFGEVDWLEAWKSHHPPVLLGERLRVIPPWCETEKPHGRSDLVIEPGMAFGLGDADSTRLTWELLEQRIEKHAALGDLGCGSGILALGARILGAGRIEAADLERPAVEATLDNAARNDIDASDEGLPPFLVHEGSIESMEGPFDILVANIVFEIVAPLLPACLMRLASGGSLVLGGIRPKHLPQLVEIAQGLGLKETERRVGDEIAAIVFV